MKGNPWNNLIAVGILLAIFYMLLATWHDNGIVQMCGVFCNQLQRTLDKLTF